MCSPIGKDSSCCEDSAGATGIQAAPPGSSDTVLGAIWTSGVTPGFLRRVAPEEDVSMQEAAHELDSTDPVQESQSELLLTLHHWRSADVSAPQLPHRSAADARPWLTSTIGSTVE